MNNKSEFSKGSYETKMGRVPVYLNSNKRDSVTINWIGNHWFYIK